MSNSVMPTYARTDISFKSGEGSWLIDTNGSKYLDAITGIGVCSLGHNHPAITQAISEQAAKLLHTSNLYQIPLQSELADKLCAITSMENIFFSNSGAEANEAAIKLARLYGHKKDIKNPTILVFENSFHGRTMATLSATGNRKVQAGFEPLVSGFARAPYNDIDALEKAVSASENIVAIMLEPIQGESGVNIPSGDFLKLVQSLCEENELLFILDEVQTGMGKTGHWFAFQEYGLSPDIVTVAKALGNGVPIGACMAANKAANLFGPGNHGSTFGGNPLACASALSVIKTIESESLLNRAKDKGQELLNKFKALEELRCIEEVRGKGLMIGIELKKPVEFDIVGTLRSRGILGNLAGGNVIRLLPPLNISDADASFLAEGVISALNLLEESVSS